MILKCLTSQGKLLKIKHRHNKEKTKTDLNSKVYDSSPIQFDLTEWPKSLWALVNRFWVIIDNGIEHIESSAAPTGNSRSGNKTFAHLNVQTMLSISCNCKQHDIYHRPYTWIANINSWSAQRKQKSARLLILVNCMRKSCIAGSSTESFILLSYLQNTNDHCQNLVQVLWSSFKFSLKAN